MISPALLSSLITGGGSLLGGVASAFGAAGSSKKAFNRQKALLEMQQSWQEHMSSTAHQREVKDLQAAGLNPVLSANAGAAYGAASASPVSGDGAIESGVNSAMAFRQLKNANELNKAQVEQFLAGAWRDRKSASLIGEQARNEAEQFLNIIAQRDFIKSQTDKNYQDIMNSKAITAANVGLLGSQAAYYSNTAKDVGYRLPYSKLSSDLYGSAFGKALYYTGATAHTARDVGQAVESWGNAKNSFSKKKYDYSTRNYYDTSHTYNHYGNY